MDRLARENDRIIAFNIKEFPIMKWQGVLISKDIIAFSEN